MFFFVVKPPTILLNQTDARLLQDESKVMLTKLPTFGKHHGLDIWRQCRFPLQALRHLYVLAAEPRCLTAVDIETQQPVPAPLRLHLAPTPDAQAMTAAGGEVTAAVEAPSLVPGSSQVCRSVFTPKSLVGYPGFQPGGTRNLQILLVVFSKVDVAGQR